MDLFLALSLCFIAGTHTIDDSAAVPVSHPDPKLATMTTEVRALEDVLRKKDAITNFDNVPAFSGDAIGFEFSPSTGRDKSRGRGRMPPFRSRMR